MLFVATSMSEVAVKEGMLDEVKGKHIRHTRYLKKTFPREKHATLVEDNVVEGGGST